ncbi:upstream activation factor subunit spp27 homolog Non2 [Haematobia irritans]|uniref:Putative nucleolar protein 2 n=1 Tax=Haematobia irritans TaxID=7368 RepID=A0A1L8EIC8_HAEIR
MADISTEQLTNEIHAVLKKADLSVVSAKKVREQVERKLDCSLLNRKKEFDKIVMDFINSQQDDEESEEEDEKEESAASEEEDPSSEEEKKKPAKKRPQATQRKTAPPKKKRKSLNASDSGTESDGGDDSDFEVSKKKKGSSGGAKNKKKAGGGGGAGRKSTGFTRAYNLSPELSSLMGAESLPRHEVVKKVWALIKERNLYDPNNKQYAICDDELLKVMKVKRFRTFGMLKHLKPHFLD